MKNLKHNLYKIYYEVGLQKSHYELKKNVVSAIHYWKRHFEKNQKLHIATKIILN